MHQNMLIPGSLQFQQDYIFHQPAGIFMKSRAPPEIKGGMHFLMNYAPQWDLASAFISVDLRFPFDKPLFLNAVIYLNPR